ncbi:MAG: hypothetical protein WKG07_13305 [Hymenobacter sp.]
MRTLADELAVLEATAQAKATYLAQLETERTQTRRDLAQLNGELERTQQDPPIRRAQSHPLRRS